ncbi:hypothetical protein [Streptomyces sp. NBC_00443]|uniref:hypothetical protein n=1 Tax=Streptomyces sp. NBC_00443 TaxID=2975743 RepID=UPI002E1C2C48
MADLAARSEPDPADRLDFEALDHPLDGLAFPAPDAFQEHLRDRIARDVVRREDPDFSADLGAFLALLSVHGQLPRLVAAGVLTARSVAEQLDGWWHGFFSFLDSGPPGFRLRRLLALSGQVSSASWAPASGSAPTRRPASSRRPAPLSPATRSTPPPSSRRICPAPPWTAPRTPSCVTCTGPAPSPRRSSPTDRTHTHRSGLPAVSAADGHVLDPSIGGTHPRRIALGAPTNSRAVAAFARPRTNAPAFRQNDAVARALLCALSS